MRPSASVAWPKRPPRNGEQCISVLPKMLSLTDISDLGDVSPRSGRQRASIDIVEIATTRTEKSQIYKSSFSVEAHRLDLFSPSVLHDLFNCLFSLLSTFFFLSVRAASLVRCFSVSRPTFFHDHRAHHCEKEKERTRKGGQFYLSFIRPFRDRPMAGGNKDNTGRTAKSTSTEKRTNAADCRVPFFPSFLPSL